MPKHRRRIAAKPGSPRAPAAAPLPTPTDPAMMVMDGSRPHETTLSDTTLADFGLDVLPVIQPHRA